METPPGRTYIAPHVQEYLAHLDSECELLTLYTVAVRNPLNSPGRPLPPFPRAGGVVQRHEEWDEHYSSLGRNNNRGQRDAPPTTGPQQQFAGVGIGTGCDNNSGTTEETTLTESPRRINGVGLDPGCEGDTRFDEDDVSVPAHQGGRSRSLGGIRRTRQSPDRRVSRVQNAAGLLAVRQQTSPASPTSGNGRLGRQQEPTPPGATPPGQPGGRGRQTESTAPDGSQISGLGRADTSGAADHPNSTGETVRPVQNEPGRARTQRPSSSTTCGGCSEHVNQGHRVVELPCGHVIHARCVLSNLERGGSRALLDCRVEGCGIQHPRQDTLEAAV